MAVYYLKCGGDPDITYQIRLENVIYDFRFRYLQRLTNVAAGTPVKADEWKLSVSLSGQPTLFETALRTNRDLLVQYRNLSDCPKGSLMLRDMVADEAYALGKDYSPERVDYENLGIDKRFRLVYITSDD